MIPLSIHLSLDARPTGRRHRSHDRTELTVTPLSTFAAIDGLIPEWRALHDGADTRNPFATPEWIVAWLRHFVPERDLALLAIRRRDRLVGVAPWYLRSIGRIVRTVQLAGTATHVELTELPQVLAAPGEHRSVCRAMLGYWCGRGDEWDWLELPIGARDGWFEPEWLGSGSFSVQHKTTRPDVIMPLPADPEELARLLKRNVWESTRRARNRLDRTGRPWFVMTHTSEDDIMAGLPVLRRLHGARAALPGRRRHPDLFADPADYRFLTDAVRALAARDRAELLTLVVEGTPVAAQLVLRSPSTSYLSCSGLDPQWWDASPVTLLQFTAMERAVLRGDTEMNLSVGVDTAKLRWSEHVVQHPEFVVCGPRPRSRHLLTGYSALAAVARVRRETVRHQPRGDLAERGRR